VADGLKADGDALANGPNLTLKNCANLPRTFFGQAVVRYQGSDHFQPGSTASLTGSGQAGITMATTPLPIPNPWNGSTGATTVSKAIQLTVPSGIANGNYSLTVTATGPKAGGGTTTADGSYKVKVACATNVDTVPPVVTVPANITVDATSQYGANVTFTASATDNVTSPISANCVPASGSLFPIGTTSVVCYATDDAGNQGSAGFNVTVRDNTPPVVTPPADMVAEATSAAGAAVTYGPASATDAIDGAVAASCSPASGSVFALGQNLVSCTASDSHGNTGSASFKVTVRDTTGPVLTGPGPITQEATGAGGAAVTYSATASDLVDGTITPACTPASGSTFGIGTNTVSCSMTDSHGNTSSGSFKVIVQDTSKPVLALPADITTEATSGSGASVAYTVSASDTVDGAITPVCSRVSGAVFSLGETTISCSATDSHGNVSSGSFKINVVDTTAPALNLPAGATGEATSSAGAAVTFAATASDAVDGSVAVTCTPASGSTFAIGHTTVQCSATDAHGNSSSDTFTVSVVDTTPPAVTVPLDPSAEATSHDGAVVTYSVSASDTVDGAGLTVTCSPASGSTFPIGMTDVTCSATDAHGNKGFGNFHVNVPDTTAPALTLPGNLTAEATGPDGASVTYSATAADIVDGAVVPACTPASASVFAITTTTVTCSATDAHGNTASGSFTVKVQDTTAPVVTVPATITAEATGPNGAQVNYDTAATDIVSGSLSVTCSLASGSVFPIVDTTVSCSATDDAGNTGTKTFHVIVQDTTAPELHLPDSITKEATGPSGASVTWEATATDIVDGSRPVSCSPASGSTFAIGDPVTVTCSAGDTRKNTANGSFTVTVTDKTAPAVSVPADITAEATGPNGAVVTFTASAHDIVDGDIAPTCAPPSGSVFAITGTTVDCSATDAHDNTGHGAFVVTVEDTTPPALTLPGPITAEATGPLGATVNYDTSATDIVDGAVTVKCSNAPGSQFPLGDTTVTCTATDAHKNQGSGTFHVMVRDTTAPALTLPGDMTKEATGPSGATASWSAAGQDVVDGPVSVSCSQASGATFPLGSTKVTCTASDQAGNEASGHFTVTVVDSTAPAVTVLPGSQTIEATGPAGAAANWSASATDVVDGSMSPTCSSASGTTFPIGDTYVTCGATDAHGNHGSKGFTITVVDTTKPNVSVPGDLIVQATSSAGANVSFAASATDVVDGNLSPVCTPPSGSLFALGSTVVTCSVTDAHRNTGTKTFTVTVLFGRDGGIRQPINPDNSSTFKRGQSVPVKFGLLGDQPAGFSPSAWTIQRIQMSCTGLSTALNTEDAPANNPSTAFRYDAGADQYIYNADFSGVPANSCWKISVDLKDGGAPLVSALFKITK
jgi:hypothetical protein